MNSGTSQLSSGEQARTDEFGRATRHRKWIALGLILAGVAVHAPTLNWGFAYDDYFHQFALRGLAASEWMQPWSLYDFSGDASIRDSLTKSRGYFWWTDPTFKVRFFRPVTSLSIWLDYALYDDWTPGYHITSLILFGVFLTLTFRLYRDLGASPVAALWALALVALEDAQGLSVGWIANRNALLAALFIVASVLCAHHHHRSGKWRHLLLALTCFLLAIGSKESGLIALPLVALYVLVFARPADGEPVHGAVLRLARSPALWCFALLAVGYLAFFVAAGYGTHSALYVTPWEEPAEYVRRLAILIPTGLQALMFGFVADLLTLYPEWMGPALAGMVPFLAVTGFILLRVVKWTPLSLFAVGWTLLALLPEAGAELSNRLLIAPSVGTALLIGLFLARLGPWRQQLVARRYAHLGLAGLLVLAGPLGGPITTLVGTRAFADLAGTDRAAILDADIDRASSTPQYVFLLNSPSSMLAMSFLPTWAVHYDDHETRVYPLQMERRPLSWSREDERTMVLTSTGTPLLDNRYERLFCAPHSTPTVDSRYPTPQFVATIVESEPTGVRTVRFTFERTLDDPAYRFLAWQDGRLRRIAPPRTGETTELPAVAPLSPFAP